MAGVVCFAHARLARLMPVGLLAALSLAACAPGAAPAGQVPSDTGAQPERAATASPTRVAIANWAEVTHLKPKLAERGGTYPNDFSFMVNSPLSVVDPQGAPLPRLAAELPSRDRGTWTVNADGTMATTWKIRPNALWHDGEPVTSRDFVFALKVYLDDGIVLNNREPERFMDRIEEVDDKTFVVHWKQIYPWAHRLGPSQLEPLPEHLVGRLYERGDKEAFQYASFWSSTAYVGNGPYRIMEWIKGSQLIYRAFDHYYLGRPKIDEVVFHITPDANAVVAFVLSGAVDVTVNTTMNQKAWLSVKQQWDRTGEGQLISIPVHLRATQFQLDPSRNKQPALLDVRVRRALVHAIDRTTAADVVLEGASMAAHVMMTPTDPLYPRMQQAIARYPYDPSRAQVLLQEAGWARRGDALVNASGQRFSVDIMTTEMADNLTEMRIMADYFSRIGMEVTQTGVPEARNRDNEYRATFPAITITGQGIDLPRSMRSYISEECPTAERRFSGSNRGCWISPEFDRLYRLANTTLDDHERSDAVIEAFRVLTEDVPIIPMSYNLDNIAVRKGLVGPGRRWSAAAGDTWNIHEWYWS